MPTYEYRCKDCGHTFEAYQSFTDDPLTECPSCQGTVKKVFSSVGISFKGSGFYKTDSRTSGASSSSTTSSGNGASGEGSSGGSSSDGSSSGDGSSKSDTSSKSDPAGSSGSSATASAGSGAAT